MTRKQRNEKEELGVQLLRNGFCTADVAKDKRIGVHPSTVRRWAKKHDIELAFPHNRHQRRVDLIDIGKILRLRKRKTGGKYLFTRKEIAALCGCSESYVIKIVAKANKVP